jgi:methylmalonyl-CoA mutase
MTDGGTSLIAEFEQPSREAWLQLVAKVLKGADFDKRLRSHSADGLTIEPLYTRAGAPSAGAGLRQQASGPWDIRQLHAEPDAALANAAILEDLAGGVSSLLLQIEAPGQGGLPYAKNGLERALQGVSLRATSIALDARENTMDAAGSLLEIWRAASIGENERHGAFNLDPVGVLAKTGTLYYPPERSCAIAAKFARDCRSMSGVRALLADGRPYHEAGASEGQELAAMLATLVAYLRACEQEGLRPRAALGKIALGLAADADLFLTIAKLRAARQLVGRIGEVCGAASAAGTAHITATTCERMMARRDPWVNILRATIACAGAALGGANAITVLPFTWMLGKPDAFARRLARNTHIVLQEESALFRVSDPGSGSFYLEALTDELAKAAWRLFQEIEAEGGIVPALQSGFVQRAIAGVAQARAKDIDHGRLALTGVSAYALLASDGIDVAPHAPAAPIVKGGAAIEPLKWRRLAEPFERLRDAGDRYLARTGRRPRLFLASLGEPAAHSVRTNWVRNFLAAGGIEALASDGYPSSSEASRAFADSGAKIACICSSDALYAKLGEATACALKAAGAQKVLLAGRPKTQVAALRAAGIDAFLTAADDAPATLAMLQKALGVGA